MASRQSRIAELANTVAQHTQRVDNYLAEKGLPYPSFEADGPLDLGLPPEVEESRDIVLQASDLLQGPRDLLFNRQICDAAFALARKYPDFHFIVQELPQFVANSKEEEGIDGKFMGHDFFEEKPVHGADVYLFRWTLHNWPDKYCIKVLKALIPALKPGARVLISEFVVPPPGVVPNNLERKLRGMDVTMLEIGNARERDLGEWIRFFEQANSRFVFKGMKQPPGSRLAVLEVVWE